MEGRQSAPFHIFSPLPGALGGAHDLVPASRSGAAVLLGDLLSILFASTTIRARSRNPSASPSLWRACRTAALGRARTCQPARPINSFGQGEIFRTRFARQRRAKRGAMRGLPDRYSSVPHPSTSSCSATCIQNSTPTASRLSAASHNRSSRATFRLRHIAAEYPRLLAYVADLAC